MSIGSHEGDCFALLAMTRHNIVIARVLAPVAISVMEQVKILLLSHVWDCFALLAMTRHNYYNSKYSS